MKNLITRSITGALFVAAVVAAIVAHPYTQLALFSVITALTVWEFATLVNQHMGLHVNRFITTCAGTYLFVAVWMFNTNMMGSAVFIPYLITLIYLLVSELYSPQPDSGQRPVRGLAISIQTWALTFMSQLYVALPFAVFNTLCFIVTPGGVDYYCWYALSLFIFLWASDTGAYLFGSWLGRHRLFPRISPKKSWEGSIGGGFTALVASQVIAHFVPFADNLTHGTNHLLWAGLAVIVVVFGTWGDLVESLFKRQLGIKDSGRILPGHGGMLDRFDSALLAIPAAVIYVYTIMMNIAR